MIKIEFTLSQFLSLTTEKSLETMVAALSPTRMFPWDNGKMRRKCELGELLLINFQANEKLNELAIRNLVAERQPDGKLKFSSVFDLAEVVQAGAQDVTVTDADGHWAISPITYHLMELRSQLYLNGGAQPVLTVDSIEKWMTESVKETVDIAEQVIEMFIAEGKRIKNPDFKLEINKRNISIMNDMLVGCKEMVDTFSITRM
jgi:hypothetical protein